jgi:hypothetical protein
MQTQPRQCRIPLSSHIEYTTTNYSPTCKLGPAPSSRELPGTNVYSSMPHSASETSTRDALVTHMSTTTAVCVIM